MFYVRPSYSTLLYGAILFYVGYRSKGISCSYQFRTHFRNNIGLRLIYGFQASCHVGMPHLICGSIDIRGISRGDAVNYLPRYYRELCVRLRDDLNELVGRF